MKALLVGPFPPPINGCAYANKVLLDGLRGMGVATDFVDTSASDVSSQQGSRFSWAKAFAFLGAYLRLYKIFGASVVYMTPGQTFFGLVKYAPFMIVAMALRTPFVIHVHGNHLGREYAGLQGWRRAIFRLLVSRASAGIVLSESLRANFEDMVPQGAVYVIENFAGDALIKAFRPELKLADTPRILYLSNLMRDKGIFDLLDALEMLSNDGVPFEATVAGVMEVGEQHHLARRFEELDGVVRYVGPILGLEKNELLIRGSNIFVLPTYYPMEGQPIALLEALASGNIIVTTRHAGIPDIVGEENGFFVPKRDSKAIATAIRSIAKDMQNNVEKFASGNATYAARRFTEEAFASRVYDVLLAVK